MGNNIQMSDGIEMAIGDKERQEQRLLSYVRKCVERKEAKGQSGK